MSELKNCPTCGRETKRDFCTPQCRMEDSDQRIEGIEEENIKLKEELKIANEGLTVAYMHGFEKGKEENEKLRAVEDTIKELMFFETVPYDFKCILSDAYGFELTEEMENND